MAKATGIYHTNPKLYYLPKQPGLGIYNDEFGAGAYLLEEYPAKGWRELDSFGNSKKIVSSVELWASFKNKKKGQTIYRPIPRDRDQAFAKYDGMATRKAALMVPFLKQLYAYGAQTKNIKWLTYGGRTFDRAYMNSLSWPEWKAQVEHIQKNLTDEVIGL